MSEYDKDKSLETNALLQEIAILRSMIDTNQNSINSLLSLLSDFVEYQQAPQYFIDKVNAERKLVG